MVSTIAATVVARVFDVGVRSGVPAAELREILGRSRAELVDDARVPIASCYESFALCLRHTRDPGFPLRVARSVTMEDYSVLGFAMMTSATAEEAFERLARYGHLISDSGTWRARPGKSRDVELSWVRAGERTLGHRAANESAVAELVGGMRRSYGASFAPVRVFFRHGAPASTREHERFFQSPIEWDSPREGILLPGPLLATGMSTGNPAMNRFFDGVLAERGGTPETCAGRVQRALAQGLVSGPPSAARLASSLGMSERSLRRGLASEGTSYRALLDELRRSVAVDMLHAKKSITETAFLLGFSETSALSRAFRRWHGTSARELGRGTKPSVGAAR